MILSACLMLLARPVSIAAQQNDVHVTRIKMLSEQLRWRDEVGKKQYETIKDQTTQNLFSEIDHYITDTFQPESATPGQIKAGLDAVLGHMEGDNLHNIVFSTNIQARRFLIVGIEIWRGGTAINDDAISFRAYAVSGSKFVHVASTENLSDSALVDLNAVMIPTRPILGEFWFIAWADVPPLAPYTVAMRLYAFDGRNFRTVWSPENIISPGIDDAVQIGPNGRVTINRLPEWDSQTILHEQYTVTADGLKKVAESIQSTSCC